MTFLQNNLHETTIDTIVKRLTQKNNSFVAKHVVYKNQKGHAIGEMDVCKVNYTNGLMYITYYEIKTGRNGRGKARQQARHFFNTHSELYQRPVFVFYNPDTGFERWKQKDF